ncbi:AraC family transcriptional regulator [uncultured Bacteroides sp.]|uniref:AraC family transcriptional regulator n=1 Tax=uncultured Bacteroides sp. TaxID=162156 RepID=UPI0025DAE5D0|nr:AraC family transcriptional regulator [uncultured Bacteroides sp.]
MPRIREGFKGERAVILPTFLIEELKQDILGRELYITDIGYYPKASFHYRKRSSEEVSEFVLIYCVEGEGWFELGNQRHKVTANQFFILPEHQAHTYGSNVENPWTIYWMHFNGIKAAFFSSGFDKPCNITPQEHSRIKERLGLFEEIYSSISSGYSKNYMLYATTSLFHFLGSMKFIGEYRDCGSMDKNTSKDVAQLAIHFMKENLNKKISLADIACEVKLSVSYFSNLFEEKTGSSPLRYLIYLRIQEACHYLDFTNLKINQISPLVGYDDSLYFSRLFNKTMGMSPSEYKSRKKG